MKKIIILALLTAIIIFLGTTANAQEEATQESDPIREKVQDKIEEVQNKPRAYLGTVTDISENNIQIKSIDGEILQVIVNQDETSFVKINSSSQTVSFEDVAIGDFLVNMGYVNTNDVLDAKRILITAQPDNNERVSELGEVTKANSSDLSLKILGGSTLLITPAKNASIAEIVDGTEKKSTFSQIAEGSTILCVGNKDNDTLEARTIRIINTHEPEAAEKSDQ